MSEVRTQNIEVAYIDKVKHGGMTKAEAICEFIDNPIQSGARDIEICIDNLNKVLVITSNGKGMTHEDVVGFCSYFKYHNTKESDICEISAYGVGNKDAAIYLSDIDSDITTSKFTFVTAEDEESDITKFTWDICRTPYIFGKKDISECKNTQKMKGVSIKLDNCTPFGVRELQNLHEMICKTYAQKLSEGVNISLKINKGTAERPDMKVYKEINGVDPMYLSVLGERINEDGLYMSGNEEFYHVVKTFYLHNKRNPDDKIGIKFVTVYITCKATSKGNTPNDELGVRGSGFYARVGGCRYVEYGNNSEEFIDRAGTGGGTGRNRSMIDIKASQTALFGVNPNKSKGITPFRLNEKLNEYVDDYGNDFTTLAIMWGYSFGRDVYKVGNGTNNTRIPFEAVKDIYSSLSNKKKEEYSYNRRAKKLNGRSVKLAKKSTKPSRAELIAKSKYELKQIDEEDNVTFYIVKDKGFIPTDKYVEDVLDKKQASLLVKILRRCKVGPKMASVIIDDYINGLRDLKQAVEFEEVLKATE